MSPQVLAPIMFFVGLLMILNTIAPGRVNHPDVASFERGVSRIIVVRA